MTLKTKLLLKLEMWPCIVTILCSPIFIFNRGWWLGGLATLLIYLFIYNYLRWKWLINDPFFFLFAFRDKFGAFEDREEYINCICPKCGRRTVLNKTELESGKECDMQFPNTKKCNGIKYVRYTPTQEEIDTENDIEDIIAKFQKELKENKEDK